MQKINELTSKAESSLSQNGQQKPASNSSGTTLTPKLISNLWERMVHLYGHKWSSIYGESATYDGKLTDAAITWGTGLSGLTGQQIADGLKACIDRGDVWPPSMPEFKQLCGGKTDKLNGLGLDYTPEYYRARETRPERMLESTPDKEQRKRAAEKGVNELRSVLGRNV